MASDPDVKTGKRCGDYSLEEMRRIPQIIHGSVAHCFKRTPQPIPPPEKIGTVYFIGAENGGPIKIGFTTNVQTRLGRLQVGSPARLEILALAHDRPRSAECGYHFRFRAFRLHGEWFERVPEIEAEIARLSA